MWVHTSYYWLIHSLLTKMLLTIFFLIELLYFTWIQVNSVDSTQTGGQIVSSPPPRNYSMVYFHISRCLDLLKMVTTVMFIAIIVTINLLLVIYFPHSVGNFFINFFLYTGDPLTTHYSLLTHSLLTTDSLTTHYSLLTHSLLTNHYWLTHYSLLTHSLLTTDLLTTHYFLLHHYWLTTHYSLTHY